mmetsp:Transcript_6627/g.18483  ORF Transcript_6627/g.18483 Transcript_6627/m.18483 type:complete len:215 (+) Transcript_6627:608-1252(+)
MSMSFFYGCRETDSPADDALALTVKPQSIGGESSQRDVGEDEDGLKEERMPSAASKHDSGRCREECVAMTSIDLHNTVNFFLDLLQRQRNLQVTRTNAAHKCAVISDLLLLFHIHIKQNIAQVVHNAYSCQRRVFALWSYSHHFTVDCNRTFQLNTIPAGLRSPKHSVAFPWRFTGSAPFRLLHARVNHPGRYCVSNTIYDSRQLRPLLDVMHA